MYRLGHPARSREVAGSKCNEGNDVYKSHWSLGFTQPLTKMIVRDRNNNVPGK
jgi:hypothetical protein